MALSSELVFMTAAEFKQQIIEDLTMMCLASGNNNPPVEPNGEWDLLATAVGNVGSVLIANQQQLDIDSNPERAEEDALDEQRQWLQLPEVGPSAAAGKVTITVIGTGSILSGQGFVAPNGLTATVISGASSVTGDVTVDAVASSTGAVGNLAAGTQVRLVGGPPNLQTVATIPLDWVGGSNGETLTQKRNRVLSRLQSGNAGWGALRDAAMSHTTAIDGAFVYWALGGPGTVKLVVTSGTALSTRQVPDYIVTELKTYLDEKYPTGTWKLRVQSAVDSPTDVEITIALPSVGANRWLASGPTSRTVVSSAVSETEFNVTSASTLGNLSIGETIACWDPTELTASTARVTAISGAAISTTVWSGGNGPRAGSWIFPSCDGLDVIVSQWLAIMRSLTPGENLPRTDQRFRFCRRLPLLSATYPANLSTAQLLKLQQFVPQATDITFTAVAPTCPLPAMANDAPYILTLNNFAIYPVAT